MELTKHAQHRIVMSAFNDELIKIAAEDILGRTNIDWDNLSEEDMQKLAKLGDGKFMKWLGDKVGKTSKLVREGNIGQGLRQGWRGLLGTLGIQNKKMKETNYDYGLKDVFGGGAKAVIGGAVDVAGAGLRGVGNAIESGGKFFGNLGNKFKEGFTEGQGDLNLTTTGDPKPPVAPLEGEGDQKPVVLEGEGGDKDKDPAILEGEGGDKDKDPAILEGEGGDKDKDKEIKLDGDGQPIGEIKVEEGDLSDGSKKDDKKDSKTSGQDLAAGLSGNANPNDLNADGTVNVLDMVKMISQQNQKDADNLATK